MRDDVKRRRNQDAATYGGMQGIAALRGRRGSRRKPRPNSGLAHGARAGARPAVANYGRRPRPLVSSSPWGAVRSTASRRASGAATAPATQSTSAQAGGGRGGRAAL